MDLSARLAPGGAIGRDDFADITAVRVRQVEWGTDGEIWVRFDGDLTSAQAARVKRRIESESRIEEDLRASAEAWLAGSALVDMASVAVQVRRLTRLVLNIDTPPPAGETIAPPT